MTGSFKLIAPKGDNCMSALQRPVHPVPDFVLDALLKEGLMDKYKRGPPYQQNDYIGWITRAKRYETQLKRLNQMLSELKTGDKYMGMDYKAK